MVAPDRGDLIWLDFNPTRGHEEAKHRPALVLSPKAYNRKSGLVLVCPITSKVKGYPFEVPVAHKEINGVILADQIRAVDWAARNAQKIGRANAETTVAVLTKLHVLID